MLICVCKQLKRPLKLSALNIIEATHVSSVAWFSCNLFSLRPLSRTLQDKKLRYRLNALGGDNVLAVRLL